MKGDSTRGVLGRTVHNPHLGLDVVGLDRPTGFCPGTPLPSAPWTAAPSSPSPLQGAVVLCGSEVQLSCTQTSCSPKVYLQLGGNEDRMTLLTDLALVCSRSAPALCLFDKGEGRLTAFVQGIYDHTTRLTSRPFAKEWF